jgi:hypothetical protein
MGSQCPLGTGILRLRMRSKALSLPKRPQLLLNAQ